GITDGPFLEGVHFDRAGGVTTHSIVIRALTGSLRYIKGVHQLKPEHIFGRMDTDGAVQIATR
ncbi:MAG: fructose-bisphosphatase class II, partial [Deltaproteobacteria bacterium]|nr:fructose-bisphosphatase class II [Deltaproteobacteria bacterium]